MILCMHKQLSQFVDSLLVVLLVQSGVSVGDPDSKLGRALDDLEALAGREVSSELGAVLAVVHQKELDISDLGDAELVEAVGQEELGLLVGAVSNGGGDEGLGLEAPSEGVIDTAGFSPRGSDTHEAVRVEALSLLGALLHNGALDQRLGVLDHFLSILGKVSPIYQMP